MYSLFITNRPKKLLSKVTLASISWAKASHLFTSKFKEGGKSKLIMYLEDGELRLLGK